MSSTLDPRVIRTRRLLTDAVTDLIVSEGYESITIREIIRRAGVNRSTFYLHFRDKPDILTQIQDDILKELTDALEYPTYTYDLAVSEFKLSKKPIESHIAMFKHIQQYASLYQKLLNENEFRKRFAQVLINEVLLFRDNVWEATYMANGAVGIILFWLENGRKETVDEMSLWLTQITLFPLGKFE